MAQQLQEFNVQRNLDLLTQNSGMGRGSDDDFSQVARVGLLLLVGLLLNYGMNAGKRYGQWAGDLTRFYLTLTLASLSVLVLALSVLYLADTFEKFEN